MKTKLTAFIVILFVLSLSTVPSVHAGKMNRRSIAMKKKRLLFYTPQLANPKYTGLEFGYLIRKRLRSLKYSFNAYTNAAITEEYYTTNSTLRAASLGFRGGVILKTQPWIPLYLQLGFGFAKTAFHEHPWFGVREKSVSTDDMLLFEAGIIYRYRSFLIRYTYQINNVSYFKKKQFLSLGANF